MTKAYHASVQGLRVQRIFSLTTGGGIFTVKRTDAHNASAPGFRPAPTTVGLTNVTEIDAHHAHD